MGNEKEKTIVVIAAALIIVTIIGCLAVLFLGLFAMPMTRTASTSPPPTWVASGAITTVPIPAHTPIQPTDTSVPTTSPTLPPLTAVPSLQPTASPTTASASPTPIAVRQASGHSTLPRISADGRTIAFTSTGNLTGKALEGRDAVFLRDLTTQTTELINQTLDGRAGRWPVYGMALSGNGRVIAYYSHDGNLVPGDEMDCGSDTQPESCEDLFIYDRDSGLTERIPLGRGMGLGKDYTVALSYDGRYLAYGIQVYDRESGQTEKIPTVNGQTPNGHTFASHFAGNGRLLAFVSSADNLVRDDNNNAYDVFVWDRETEQVTRVSVSNDGSEANELSGAIPFHEGTGNALAISGNGRFVAFSSLATNLTGDPIHECDDYRGFIRTCYNIFLHDRETGHTQLITPQADGDSVGPKLSTDGRFLIFASIATNLIDDALPCDFPAIVNCGQIYLYNTQTGQTTLISRAPDGAPGNEGSYQPVISGDGRFIAFVSTATNLSGNDTNDDSDIFLFEQNLNQFKIISSVSR